MTDFLASAVGVRPDRIGLTDGRRSWSFRELDGWVRTASERLVRLGARPGRPAALIASPSADAVVGLHALFRSGAVVVPLNPDLAAEAMAETLDLLDPSPIVVDGTAGAAVDPAAGGTGGARTVTLADVVSAAGSDDPSVVGRSAGPDSGGQASGPGPDGVPGIAAVLWTSGTSGRRRGVLVTAEGLRRSARASRARLELGPDDRWYASLSPAHVGGLALVTRAALLGSSLVATGPFRADELSRLMDDGRVTHASVVPTMLRRLLDHRNDRAPPPSFR
ncbi:MAG: class I adenylate-forming enzyme family protein, partial [Gemmatimonadota bacterium]